MVLAIVRSPLVTTNDFTRVGPMGCLVKVGDVTIHRWIEYLRVNLVIRLKVVLSIIRHLGQVKLLLLIQNLNVLMSLITDGRMSVNELIARSREEGWCVNLRLAVIWCWANGCILRQSLLNRANPMVSSLLLLVKLITDGAVQLLAALFCRDFQILLLIGWHPCWCFDWLLLLKILISVLGHYYWCLICRWLLLLWWLLKLLVLL